MLSTDTPQFSSTFGALESDGAIALSVALLRLLGGLVGTHAVSSTTLPRSASRKGRPFVPSYSPSTVSKPAAGVALMCTVALLELVKR